MDEFEKTAAAALAQGNWSLYTELTKVLLPPGEYIARFEVADDGSTGLRLVHKDTQLEIGARGRNLLHAMILASYHMKHDSLLQKEKQ